jgi:hypothetical protein
MPLRINRGTRAGTADHTVSISNGREPLGPGYASQAYDSRHFMPRRPTLRCRLQTQFALASRTPDPPADQIRGLSPLNNRDSLIPFGYQRLVLSGGPLNLQLVLVASSGTAK